MDSVSPSGRQSEMTGCFFPAGSDEGYEREKLGAGGDVEREKFPEEPQHLPDVDWTEATSQVAAGHRLEPGCDAHRSSVLWDERGRQVPCRLHSIVSNVSTSGHSPGTV